MIVPKSLIDLVQPLLPLRFEVEGAEGLRLPRDEVEVVVMVQLDVVVWGAEGEALGRGRARAAGASEEGAAARCWGRGQRVRLHRVEVEGLFGAGDGDGAWRCAEVVCSAIRGLALATNCVQG